MRMIPAGILLALLASVRVSAQTEPPYGPGDRIRVTFKEQLGRRPFLFILREVRTDTIVVQLADSNVLNTVPLARVLTLEVRHERSRAEGGLIGAGIGIVVGSALGFFAGEGDWKVSAPGWAALGGAVLGATMGTAYPGEKWKHVIPPE